MTVSRLDNSVKSNCNGSTVEFPFEFPILESSDLTVTLINSSTGAETVLVEGTNYRVDPSDSGYTAGGTVTTQAAGESGMEDYAYPSGYQILIERSVPSTQTMDLRTGQNIDLQDLEDAMDKLQMQVIDMKNQIDRCIQIPTQDGSLTTLLDPAVVRADKFLHFDEEGNAHASSGPIVGITPTTYAESLLDAEDAEEARAVLGIVDASETVKGIAELATQTETDAGTDDARIVTPKKLYTTPGVYRKNLIINGDMMVWQRGTSGFTAEGFTADRWGWIQGSDATVSFSRSTDVPSDAQGGGRFSASLKMDVTGADTSIGAAQFLAIRTKLEGFDIRTLVGQNATLSFWVKAVKPGTYCVVFLSGATDRMYPVEYTINSANTWEKKTITVPMTDCANGTWNFTNGVGLQIRWVIAAGSTYNNGTNETWGTTGLYGTPNQVNGLDSTNNDFYLTGVQLEKGSVATPFEHRPFAEELALCQRYYQFGSVRAKMYAAASQVFGYQLSLPVVMRAAPTLAFSNAIYEGAAGVGYSSPWLNSSFFVYATKDGSAGMGNFQADYTASAEL